MGNAILVQGDNLISTVLYSFSFLFFLEDISPFRGITDTPVLDLW